MKIRIDIVALVVILITFFIFGSTAYAVSVSDISFTDSDVWEYSPNEGYLPPSASYLKFESGQETSNKFPFLRTIKNPFPISGDVTINFEFKFITAGGFGSGIAISPSTPQKNGTDITTSVTDYTLFNIWQSRADGFGIYAWICPENQSSCNLPVRVNSGSILGGSGKYNFLQHKIKLEYSDNGTYRLFVDDATEPLFVSNKNQKRPSGMWIGHSLFAGSSDTWSSFEMSELSYEDTFKKEKAPIIIVPGLGASWDFKALLSGTSGSSWTVPSFVTTYDSLIKSLENAGYEKDKDLFVFAYDWRKPVDKLSEELSAFVIGHTGEGQKVNLIGHSMGGLVSRIYGQNYGVDKINKLMTLGSPHKGALDAYSVWEGTKLWGDIWWGKAAIETVVQLNGDASDNRVQALRSQVPSIKDLLPVYDYLIYQGKLKKWSDLSQKNNYLDSKNQNISSLLNVVSTLNGNNEDTKTIVKTEARSKIDSLLGLWEDGEPVKDNPFTYSKGDGTVTTESAVGGFSLNQFFSSNHVGLPGNKLVIESVFDVLGLDKSKIEILSQDDKKSVYLAALRSPGRLEVCTEDGTKCDSELGIYDKDNKFFMLPGFDHQTLRVRILSDGLGEYKLHQGNIDETASWNVISGKINDTNQVDTYLMHFSGDTVSAIPDKSTNINLLRYCKSQMLLKNPNWDRQNNIDTLYNPSSKEQQILRAVNLLRTSLRNEMWKNGRRDKNSSIQTEFDCWNDIDGYLKGEYITKTNRFRNPMMIKVVEHLGETIEKLIKNTNRVTAVELFRNAESKLEEAKLYEKDSRFLGAALAESAQELYITALGLR